MIYLFGIIMPLILYMNSEAKFLTGTKLTAYSTVFPNFKVDYRYMWFLGCVLPRKFCTAIETRSTWLINLYFTTLATHGRSSRISRPSFKEISEKMMQGVIMIEA